MQMRRRNAGASNASLVRPKQWDADDTVDVPTTFGPTKARKPSLRELFFGDLDRVPHAGGFKLSSDRRYRFTVKAGNQVYDLDGRQLATPVDARVYRFWPGALFDFNLSIPERA